MSDHKHVSRFHEKTGQFSHRDDISRNYRITCWLVRELCPVCYEMHGSMVVQSDNGAARGVNWEESRCSQKQLM